MSPSLCGSRLLTSPEQAMFTRLLQSHCTFCSGEPMQAFYSRSSAFESKMQVDDRRAVASCKLDCSLTSFTFNRPFCSLSSWSVQVTWEYTNIWLVKLMLWVSAMGYVSYAQWLFVHTQEVTALEETHPDVVHHFCSGSLLKEKQMLDFCYCTESRVDPHSEHRFPAQGAFFISAQLSSDAVSALRKFRVLVWL